MKEPCLIEKRETKVVSLPAETRYAENGIVSRTVLDTGQARLILFGFAAGQKLSEHLTTRHAVVQILSGRCQFSLEGVWHTLEAGSLVHMPPNVRHAVQATEDFSMMLTLVNADPAVVAPTVLGPRPTAPAPAPASAPKAG